MKHEFMVTIEDDPTKRPERVPGSIHRRQKAVFDQLVDVVEQHFKFEVNGVEQVQIKSADGLYSVLL